MTAVAAETLGRFELRRQLGKGAQATVWLAFDPRLEREVAVKLMHPDAATMSVNQWLQEARSVARLNHPHIVPVFEADVHERQPYLVFEYVPGRTLAALLRARGALPAREAVEMVVGVLDALQLAHAAGVVHRDLKPSNILVDDAGRARVMDFGIAGRVQDTATQQPVVGTPGYMSPEATHGQKPAPSMDVFSAGLVLAEMLSGQPVIAERDPYRAIYRVAHEDQALPDTTTGAEVDDALRAIVLRALARDPIKRYATAGEMRDALQQWLSPTPVAQGGVTAVGSGSAGAGSGTLDFLLRRMRHKSDFPAMSDSVARIQRVANSDSESLASLSSEILKDVALTHKLLRMVNTAHYSQAGGSVSTVSRAVALVGFAGIRNMALSLVLLEHMHDKAHAHQLKDEFLRALMAASLAAEFCGVQREGEEAFLAAMFQNLGRLLTEFYFPEEARQIRSLCATAQAKAGAATWTQRAHEESTAIHVLGLSFEELGRGVAKAWSLPDGLQRSMLRPAGDPPAKPCDKPAERVYWAATAANEVTDALLLAEPGRSSAAIAAVAERYARALGLDARAMQAATALARQRLRDMAVAMSLHVQPGSPMRRLLESPGNGTATVTDPDSLAEHELQATMPVGAPLPDPTDFDHEAAAAMLAAGIQDITNTMVEDFKLNEVLRMILETMLRALGFRRIVFCLRDPKTETLTGRFGLGEGVEAVSGKFKVPLKPATGAAVDLFGAVCLKGADTLIADATVPNVAARLPGWYRQGVNAPAFLLLPLMMKGAPFALIYADKAQPGGIDLGDKELSLLRTLRNQAVMAFKQTS